MFHDELPHISNLFCAAGSITFRGVDISATGLGDSLDEALALQNAEFAERKSFVLGPAERGIKPVGEMQPAAWAADVDPPNNGQDVECLAARNLHSGEQGWFPARMISSFGSPAALMAEGTAAGVDAEMATLNAVLEAIERHTARKWWLGHSAPTQPSARALDCFCRLQRCWSRHQTRRTELLNITPEFGVPVYAAWSCREDGTGLCFGLSCHPMEEEAVRGALKELLQMEFGLDVIAYRQRNGVTLADREQRILDRACNLNVDDCTLLLTPDREPVRCMDAAGAPASVELAAHLGRFGIAFYRIDLPPTDVHHHVVHAFSADLRLPQAPAMLQSEFDRQVRRWTGWDLY